MVSYKKHFSRFLNAAPDRLHFAAHSHHPWPDVTFDAHQQAWNDAARLADLKWDHVFGEVVPEAQNHVARVLNLPDPKTLVFAPSTHELVVRLLSALTHRPLRVLTTDGEFHSFSRQLKRLEEAGAAQARRVAVEPFESFPARLREAIGRGAYDLLYFSQCFYNTGYRLAGLDALVRAVPDPQVPVVIDGYHGYMAVPTDLSAIADRAFYVAGGYKYAMCGEGACFMHCPPGFASKPVNTGWFASFGTLTAAQDTIQYAAGGQRFMGATFDPAPLYRLNAVQRWLRESGVTVATIRAHVEALQQQFLARRDLLPGAEQMPPEGTPRGNFLIFRHAAAPDWHRRLLEADVLTDLRADRLRIGFGLYQDPADVDELARRIRRLAP